MSGWKICGAWLLLCVLAGTAFGQVGPVPDAPQAVVLGQHVPVTVVVRLDGVLDKVVKEFPVAPAPLLDPDFFPGKKPLFPGKLLQKIREKKPLQKLLAVLTDRQDLTKELEKLSQPVNLDGDLWLSLNLREVVFAGVDVQVGLKQLAVQLAVQLEPVLVLSKEKPEPMPLPKITFGGALPPAPGGTPLNILLKISPKALPQILPPETKETLAQYGVDCGQISFVPQPSKPGAKQTGPKLFVAVPLQKPLAANLSVWFTPKVKDNVLTFVEPDCSVMVAAAGKKDDGSFNQTLQKLTQETIRGLLVAKLKSAAVDFTPHIKKMAALPLGQPGPGAKFQAPLSDLRVEDLSAADNHLVLRITGIVAKGGIVVFAPH